MRAMELSPSDPTTAIRVAVANLDARIPSLEQSQIESVVRRRVEELFAHARVKNFVGILAERDARDELVQLAS